MNRTDLLSTIAAAAAVAAGCVGFIVSGVCALEEAPERAARQAMAESAYMYVDFGDDFQDPRAVALGWRGSDGWRLARRPGSDGFMQFRDPTGAAGMLLASHGRVLLAYNFTMYVDVRPSDIAGEAGLAWGADRDLGWRAVVSGKELRLVRADASGEREVGRCALPQSAVPLRLAVISGSGTFSVAVGDAYMLQAPWDQGNNPGRFGLWAKGRAEFDNFALQARPLDPGTLALARVDPGGNLNIYIGPADGGEGRFITDRPGNNFFPAWSPDATRLGFQTDEGEGKTSLWTVDVSGRDPREVAKGPYSHPAWSPDGRGIACDALQSRAGGADQAETREIMVLAADGSGMKNITNNPADDFYPAWSPDGRKLAFCSDRDGGSHVFVANADGSSPVNITKTAGLLDSEPAWSPDGTRIACVAAETAAGRQGLYVMSAAGADAKCIWSNPVADARTPAWSPDGEKISFTEERSGDFDVIIVNADGSDPFRAFGTEQPELTAAWRPPDPQPEPQIAVASVWGYPGKTVTVPILAQGVRGMRAATIELTWDRAAIKQLRAARGDVVNGEGWSFDADVKEGSATLRISSQGLPAWRESGALAELQFDLPASAKHGAEIALTIPKVSLDMTGVEKARARIWNGGVVVLAADRVEFAPLGGRQTGGAMARPFEVRLRAVDDRGETCSAFAGTVRIESPAGPVTPRETEPFKNGQWLGKVSVAGAADETFLTATDAESGAAGRSGAFRLVAAGSITGGNTVGPTDLERAADIVIGALTPTEPQALAADVNGDGSVTVADVADIARIVRGGNSGAAPGADSPQVALHVAAANPTGVVATVSASRARGLAVLKAVVTHPGNTMVTSARLGDALGGWKLRAKDVGERLSLVAYDERGAGVAAESVTMMIIEFSGSAPQGVTIERAEAADGAGKALQVAIDRKTG
jgi:hypothetical protein